jgi:DNA processing protein
VNYKNLAHENLCDVLRLIRTSNVGPITFFQLLRRYGSAAEALSALPHLSLRGGRQISAMSKADAEKEIAAAQKFGTKMILYGAADYPKWLLSIPDAPPILTVSGHPHLWQRKDCIAMVGARNASAAGCQFATRLARELSENGLTVVSGLARGIDAFAHKGALAYGTVGVIAGGIDNIYPPENAILFQQMRETGAVVSEQPFGLLPFSGAFPGRNRIIAGMSLGTVVVEASPKSGSLITARFANENGRDIFAVPGSPLDARSRGCNQLIRQGATMVETVDDILQGIARLRGMSMEEIKAPAFVSDDTTARQTPDESELNHARDVILEKLSVVPVSVDELIEQCGISASAALTVILELELAGKIRRGSGNKVGLVVDSEEGAA